MGIQLNKDGKIADPAARAAAQALLRCFLEGGDENEKAWLDWALKQPPQPRKEVYVLVWHIFLKMPKPVAKTANSRPNQPKLKGF